MKLAADEAFEQVLRNFKSAKVGDFLSEIATQTGQSNSSAGLDVLPSIIEQICDALDVERIYCFGKRTYQDSRYHPLDNSQNAQTVREHFDLLIITADQPARRDVALQSKNRSRHRYLGLLR